MAATAPPSSGADSAGEQHLRLIRPLVESMALALPCNRRMSDFVVERHIETANQECLVRLSLFAMDPVLRPLAAELQQIGSLVMLGGKPAMATAEGVDVAADIKESQLINHWDKHKDTRPPLDPHLVSFLVTQAYNIMKAGGPEALNDDASPESRAGRVLYALSLNSFDGVFSFIPTALNQLTLAKGDDSPDILQLIIIPHLHYNKERVVRLLQEVSRHIRFLKKSVQLALAHSICEVCDRWMEDHPAEFVELQADGSGITGAADGLFDAYSAIAEKTVNRKVACWPVQMRLLILNPELLMRIHNSSDDPGQVPPACVTRKKFLDALRKAFISAKPPLCDVAMRAYIDLCVASTFVEKTATTTCLRHLVPPIEASLAERLFNVHKPYFVNVGPTEELLLTRFLTATFRLNPTICLNQYMLTFLTEPDIPVCFRTVAVRTLLSLTGSPTAESLAWNPSPDITYPVLARGVRRLLDQTLASTRIVQKQDVGALRRLKKDSRAKSITADGPTLLLLEDIVQLLATDSNFAFYHVPGVIDGTKQDRHWYPSADCDFVLHDTKAVLSNLGSCLQEAQLAPVMEVAADTLVSLCSPAHVMLWNPSNLMPSFWEISSSVIISLAIQLIGVKNKNEVLILQTMQHIMASRNEFLRARKALAGEGSGTAIHRQTFNKLEVVFLTHMCSSDPEVISATADCFGLLCEESDILIEVVQNEDMIEFLQPNLEVYRQLSKFGQQVTGYRAHQKQIMTLLRQVPSQTPGSLAAWDGLLSLWLDTVDQLTTANEDEGATYGPMPPQLSSITGFLCSLGGVCLMGQTTGDQSPLRNVRRFVKRLLELLRCDLPDVGPEVRAMVKEGLGQELNPTMYPVLFEEMNQFLERSLVKKDSSTAVASASNTLLVDQAIVVTRMCLESKIDSAASYLPRVDIESLVLSFVNYLRSVEHNESTEKAKIGLCKLMTIILEKRFLLTFRHEMLFRNRMVDHIIPFVSTGAPAASGHSLQADLDMACMQAIATLFSGLPLQPLDDDEADVMSAKSKLFLKYFTFLMNITNRCRPLAPRARGVSHRRTNSHVAVEGVVGGGQDSSDKSPGGQQQGQQGSRPSLVRHVSATMGLGRSGSHKRAPKIGVAEAADDGEAAQPAYKVQRTERQLKALRESSQVAMSHLLSANVEVGLGHSITMGYHEDVGVRLAFTEVMTKVLQQGAEFDTLAETAVADRYLKLVTLLTGPDLMLVRALSATVDKELDELSSALMGVFTSQGLQLPFIHRVAQWEVEQCKTPQTLFRRNSLCTKVATTFMRRHGQAFLEATICPLIEKMRTHGPEHSYEVDPNRFRGGEDLEANLKSLHELSCSFLDGVLRAEESLPEQLRIMFMSLRMAAERKFPDAKLSAVGGLMFLRFFTPAMVTPQAFAIIKDPLAPRLARGLLLASKVVQAMANCAPFSGVKEVFMQRMNYLVVERTPHVQGLLAAISTVKSMDADLAAQFARFGVPLPAHVLPRVEPGGGNPRASFSAEASTVSGALLLASDINEGDVISLHRILNSHIEKVGRELTVVKEDSSNTLFDTLLTLLAQLGEPPKAVEVRRMSMRANSSSNSPFEEFLSRHRILATSTEQVASKNIFYAEGKSKARRPVMYYIARRYSLAELDTDQMLYHVFSTMKPLLRSPFDLVIDLTMFHREHIPPLSALERFFSCLPPEANQNLVSVYVVNPSSHVKLLDKLVVRAAARVKMHKRLKYVDPAQLQEYIDAPVLPQSTLRLCDTSHEFAVTTISKNHKQHVVTLKVGASSLQVLAAEKGKFLGVSATFVDFYDAARLSSVTQNGDAGHIEINYNLGAELLKLKCEDSDALFQLLHETWQRHMMSAPEAQTQAKVLRPGEVPGTLLNIGLLNLGSAEPSLRLAAYNFLAAVRTTFDFQIGSALVGASGLAIPENNNTFITRISEHLAAQEPGLTLEFLDECIAGLSTSTTEQKHLCLEYMQPWLPNVHKFATSASSEKMNRIIRRLVDVTIDEKQLYASLQAKVWHTIGSVDELAVIAIDQFIKVATQAGPATSVSNVMADASVTLAAANTRLVAGIVVQKMLKTLRLTSQNPRSNLSEHTLWPDIQVLARFMLMLSFNDRLDLEVSLPEVLHVATLLAGSGPMVLRASIHGMVVNVAQSLCTTLDLPDETLRAVRLQLTEMTSTKVRLLFGLSGKTNSADVIFDQTGSTAPTVQDAALNMHSHQALVVLLWELMKTCERPQSAWRARWLTLAEQASFRRNPFLQPRAIVSLGIITESLPAELMMKLLRTLTAALKRVDALLIESIATCLARLLRLVPQGSFYHNAMFWATMAMLQFGEARLFSATLAVLETTLQTLNAHGAFDGVSIEEVVMSGREAIKDLCDDLDKRSGFSFSRNFTFAVAGALFKGFSHPSPATISRTTRVFILFLNAGQRREQEGEEEEERTSLHRRTLGYLVGVLPVAEEIRAGLGIQEAGPQGRCIEYGQILNKNVVQDTETAALLVACACARLEHCKRLSEKRYIYQFLAEAATLFPEVFSLVSSLLDPNMAQTISRPQDRGTVAACHVIVQALLSAQLQAAVSPTLIQDLGFGGFFTTSTFSGEAADLATKASICAQMLEQLISGSEGRRASMSMSIAAAVRSLPAKDEGEVAVMGAEIGNLTTPSADGEDAMQLADAALREANSLEVGTDAVVGADEGRRDTLKLSDSPTMEEEC